MRYDTIDFVKGIAIILMIIFHIFYFPNVYGYKEFQWNTPTLKLIAKIAQFIFITCAGINIYLSYHSNKEKNKDKNYNKIFLKKHLTRIFKLSIIALLLSFFSYLIFGELWIKFGILHFMALGSLLVTPYIDNQIVNIFIIVLILLLTFLKNNYKQIFYLIPPKIAFVSGLYSFYPSMDHFPLIPWLALMSFGLLIGKYIVNLKNKELLVHKNKNIINEIGKNSLEIYVVHWIILYIFFAHIYPKFHTNLGASVTVS